MYEVIVGNIGSVHVGRNKRVARRVASEYAELSISGVGRAANELVTLLCDNEIVWDNSADMAKESDES